MSRFTDHPAIYDQLICLSEREKQSPMEVIKDFFEDFRLSELRDIQDQIQRVCLTSDDGAFSQPEGRATLLSYNDKLIRLLEAASYLQDSFVPLTKVLKTEVLPKLPAPLKHFDKQVSDLVKGINDVAVDVAHLCVVVVNAWTDKFRAEMDMVVSNSKKQALQVPWPSVDLDKLQSMAITLQDKLTKLAGIAVDILVSELNIHYLNQNS